MQLEKLLEIIVHLYLKNSPNNIVIYWNNTNNNIIWNILYYYYNYKQTRKRKILKF